MQKGIGSVVEAVTPSSAPRVVIILLCVPRGGGWMNDAYPGEMPYHIGFTCDQFVAWNAAQKCVYCQVCTLYTRSSVIVLEEAQLMLWCQGMWDNSSHQVVSLTDSCLINTYYVFTDFVCLGVFKVQHGALKGYSQEAVWD